jgi:hypothetical protein
MESSSIKTRASARLQYWVATAGNMLELAISLVTDELCLFGLGGSLLKFGSEAGPDLAFYTYAVRAHRSFVMMEIRGAMRMIYISTSSWKTT